MHICIVFITFCIKRSDLKKKLNGQYVCHMYVRYVCHNNELSHTVINMYLVHIK